MSASEDSAEKSHEPSQRKLEEARRKGEVARSADLSVAAAYGGLLLALIAVGTSTMHRLGTTLQGLLGDADRWRAAFFGGRADDTAGALMMGVAGPIAPLFLVPAAAVLLSVFAQQALIFAPSKLEPKLSRISILSNAKNKFGRVGLFEFAKSFAKLVILSIVLSLYLAARFDRIVASVAADPAIGMAILARFSVELLGLMVLVMAGIGAVDFLWQRQEHMRKNRMSHKEMRDELKDSDGDPQMKQSRRQKAQEIAGRRMMQDVPTADVIIVNPTHYAVALKWSRLPGSAPTCVAKGVDEIARRIREIAAETGVPVHSDPPTARALFASVEIGCNIAPEHYRAVAAAIRFAEMLKRKAGQR